MIIISFPATYNITYYQGDLYQFVIRPKNSAGDPFPISDSTHTSSFYISTSRGGSAGNTLTADTSISNGNITATIFPTLGNQLSSGTTYYYDISVTKNTDTNEVYTLLTGTINVTADITEPA